MSRKPGTGRRRIQMKMIESRDARQVCFSKRRSGLFKKAADLAAFFRIYIAIVVFSPGGKAYTFGQPSVDAVLDRFLNQVCGRIPTSSVNSSRPMLRHLYGNGGGLLSNDGHASTVHPILNSATHGPGHDRGKRVCDGMDMEHQAKLRYLGYIDELKGRVLTQLNDRLQPAPLS